MADCCKVVLFKGRARPSPEVTENCRELFDDLWEICFQVSSVNMQETWLMTDQSTDYNNTLVIYGAVKDLYANGNIASSGQMSDSLVVLRHISNDVMQLTSFMASLSDSFLPALHNPSWIQCSSAKKRY